MVTISVITPTFNRAGFIEAAVNSVFMQDVPAFEHIVIDGGSHDDTLARLRKFPALRVVSEPDRGLYDAINKGIRLARGEVICLLNSDDQLMPGAFKAVSNAFAADPAAQSVCGRVRIGAVTGDGQRDIVSAGDTELGTDAMQQLRAGDVISGLPLTNARFFRRAIFETIGLFDQDFPVLADRDFLGRLWLSGARTAVVDQVLYRYGVHGQSLSFGSGSGQLDYNVEAVRLAGVRLAARRSTHARGFYQRWLGWAIGYLFVRATLDGGWKEAWARSRSARRELPWWPLAFVVQMMWHLATRHQRRGRTA